MNEKIITVFTPTYNRAYTLGKCYSSLIKQKDKRFKWLIIDDGSIDNTKDLVLKWKKENLIHIDYIYKENGGMHTGHNLAYEKIDTKLNVCIDSDDYLTDDAIEIILTSWEKCEKEKIGGMIFLDIYENGNVIGSYLPKEVKTSKFIDIYHKYGVTGDKKLVYRTELTKKFPYPEYKDEKFVPLSYKYKKLDAECSLAIFNKPVCVVEYMQDGSSLNMFKQYYRNPKGWSFYRLENLKLKNTSLKFKYKECIHYISSSLLLKEKKFIKKTNHKFIMYMALIPGCFFYLYIVRKNKK